ncbi:hypothetical protein [Saccharibacillus endophyticus]|uniref:LysM domain-containing protein n=1 Tax=Saccharibacillus endophyticus TaxID=2060666 RepID=A0ABQ1ZRG8_9BACL|nr:hypothetical protein [Saccharibacillus endophyticus]GGH76998.1 hypothetical protein GCM10007362_20090 [Saccharibacillus endophyticus]
MNRKIATGALALALAAGGSAAVSHTYADAAAAPSSGSQTTAPTISSADPLQSGKPLPGPGGHGLRGGAGSDRAELSSLLKLTEDELKTRQEAGETLSAIATAQGVDPQSVIDLLVSKHETKLKEELAAGDITQTQHDERLAKVQERAQKEIEQVFDASKKGPGKGPHGGPGAGIGPKEEREAVASLLGLTSDQLKTRQEAGESLEAIATAQGVDKQKLIDLLVSDRETKLKEELAAGDITQAQYDERAAEAREHAGERIARVIDPAAAVPAEGQKRPGGPRGERGGAGENVDAPAPETP